MRTIYVDEKTYSGNYGLGVLVIQSETWRQEFLSSLREFRPPLAFHATVDRQIDSKRFGELKTFIVESICFGLQNPAFIEWEFFERKSEKEAWKAFVSWAYRRYQPTCAQRLSVYRDRGNLLVETAAMLAGNDKFLIQQKPKVSNAETNVEAHKILIGVVDYILYSGELR